MQTHTGHRLVYLGTTEDGRDVEECRDCNPTLEGFVAVAIDRFFSLLNP